MKIIKNFAPSVMPIPFLESDEPLQLGHIFFMKNEIWEKIDNCDYDFFVSNHGRVRSFGKTKNGKLLKCFLNSGYPSVVIKQNGIYKSKKVHRLVATAFIPNPDNKQYINHKNGIKTDNRIENLEWCTMLENNIHAYKTGLKILPKGIQDKRSKPVYQYDKQGNLLNIFESLRDVTRKTGFKNGCISNCISGRQKSAYNFLWKR